jgi:acyl carrier protein
MTKKDIVILIKEVLVEIQDWNGEEETKITSNTVPIGGLAGFDSLSGVEFTVQISKKIPIPDNENLCVSCDKVKALSVGEIADRLVEITNKPEKKGKR